MRARITRRSFIQGAALGAGALTIGVSIDGPGSVAAAGPAKLNAFLRIEQDGSVVLLSPFAEMGQGVLTSQAQLVAEELDYPVEAIRVEHAPSEPAYALARFTFDGSDGAPTYLDLQLTGGSDSTRLGFTPLRHAGAAAREMLRRAAAERWGVPLDDCRADAGAVHHATGGRLTYAALAEAAARLAPPDHVALKPARDWSVIGRSVPRVDLPDKVRGTARFGIDTRPDGAWVGTVLHAPLIGGRLRALDEAPALAVPGVHRVVRIESGVAVVADSFWQALTGARALRPEWEPGPRPALTTDDIRRDLRVALDRPGSVVLDRGDAPGAIERAAERHEAVYEVPFVPHMAMEPMNAAARVSPDRVEIWAPTQSPSVIKIFLSQAAGIAQDRIHVHTTLQGGAFGRRSEPDVALEAVAVAQAIGRPVQLIWSREQDIGCQCGLPGPMAMARMQGGLDRSGRLTCLDAEIASPSVMGRLFPPAVSNGLDLTTVQGLDDQPYAIPDYRASVRIHDPGIPVSFWRSVSHRPNGFFVESFVNEMAHRAGRDPFDFRESLIAADEPHVRALLRVLRDASGWDRPPLPGRTRGMAMRRAMGSVVGQVAEISADEGAVRVHRVTCVIDCGPPVNPDTIRAQMEGSIVDGLNTAFNGGITISDGRVEESQFFDFDWIGIGQVPEIDVRIAPGQAEIGGAGEPGLPPIAPAVADAIFRATGTRIRAMPFRSAGFTLA